MNASSGHGLRRLFIGMLLILQTSLTGTAAESSSPVFTNALGKTSLQSSLRLRFDATEFETDEGDTDRIRYRLRARLGATHEFNDHLSLGVRSSTGSQEPTSSQVDFGDEWEGFLYKLDQIYARYAPTRSTTFWAGQIPNPIVEADLLWDKDVNPQGLGEQFTWSVSDETELFLNAGQFLLDHFWEDTEPKVMIGQVGTTWKNASDIEVRTALAYYDYLQVEGKRVPFQRDTNSRRPDGSLLYDFNVLAFFGELETSVPLPLIGSTPLRITLEGSENLAAAHAGTGFKADVRLGRDKRRGDLSLLYSYEWLERDATLDSLSESSWHSQRVNFSGHRLSGRYYVLNRLYLNLTLRMMSAIDGPKDDQKQLNLDLGWEF